MNKLGSLLETWCSSLSAITLIVMMLHTVVNAVSRYLFDAPLDGTSELVTYWYLPIISLVGFVAAQWRREHIRVSLLVDRLRQRNQLEYLIFSSSVGFLFCVGLSWFGLSHALYNFDVGMTAGVTSIPLWPVTFLVPVVFSLLSLLFVADIFQAVRGDSTAVGDQTLDAESAAQ